MMHSSSQRSMDELLYSLSTSFERYKGSNGFQRLFEAGKLSFLSFLGEFQQTKDELYERRAHAVLNTRRCLFALNDQVDGITNVVKDLVKRLDGFFLLLQDFHKYCDLELLLNEDDNREHMMVFTQQFHEMSTLNRKLHEAFSEFSECKSTCRDLNLATIAQLEVADKESAASVLKTQTEFDVIRREVQAKTNDLERARSQSSSDAFHLSIPQAENNLRQANDRMNAMGGQYVNTVRSAMTSTSFALEQTSMTTWASCNVFFVQLTLFLSELTLTSSSVGDIMNVIKNSQKISQSITQDKKVALERAAHRASSSAEHINQMGSGGSGSHAEVDLFSSSEPQSAAALSCPQQGVESGNASQATATHLDPFHDTLPESFYLTEHRHLPQTVPASMNAIGSNLVSLEQREEQIAHSSDDRTLAASSVTPRQTFNIDDLFS